MKFKHTIGLLFILLIVAGCRAPAPTQQESATLDVVAAENLPLLPDFTKSNTNGIGEPLPGGAEDPFTAATFDLQTELPAGPETLIVEQHELSQINEAEARQLADQFGFTGPLYIQKIAPEFDSPEGEEMPVVYTAFDGQRLININNIDLIVENRGVVVDFNQRPVFSEVAPQVESQLKAWGLLDFPYEIRELHTGDLAIYRLINGYPAEHNAYSFFFNHEGEFANFSYQPLRETNHLGTYPVQTAETTWELLQDPAGRKQMRYQLWPQPVEEVNNEAAFINPRSWSPNRETGQEIHLYMIPAIYEAIDGSGLYIVHGDFVLAGDPDELAEIATHLSDVLHVWGTTGRSDSGATILEVNGWEIIDQIQYETLEGVIVYADEQPVLQTLNGETFSLIPAAEAIPAGIEVYVNVAGRRDAETEFTVLDWVSINEKVVWPDAPVIEPDFAEPATIQTITIDAVDLVYFTLFAADTFPYDSLTQLFMPVWKFSGTTDHDQLVIFWLPAVASEYMESP